MTEPWSPDVDLALSDAVDQPDEYRPTPFWADACDRIARECRDLGMSTFRRHPTALSYFVPTYGRPGNGFTESLVESVLDVADRHFEGSEKSTRALENFLSGHAAALADFRVVSSATNVQATPRLDRFSESDVGSPVEQFEFGGRRFSRSSLNYLLGLTLLKQHVTTPLRSVLEIGGGFGSLGEILSSADIDELRYIDVDLPPVSCIAEYYLARVLGADRVAPYASTRDLRRIDVDDLPSATVLNGWQIERLQGSVDLFVNFISFQEMEPSIVENYLRHVDRLGATWILLRNLREGKPVRTRTTVGVDEPILGADYARMLNSYELVDRSTARFGYRTVDGFHSEVLLMRRKDAAQ